jgi:hypothetical protein
MQTKGAVKNNIFCREIIDTFKKEQCHIVRTPAAHNKNWFGNCRKLLGRHNPPLFRSCIMNSEVSQNMHILHIFL